MMRDATLTLKKKKNLNEVKKESIVTHDILVYLAKEIHLTKII